MTTPPFNWLEHQAEFDDPSTQHIAFTPVPRLRARRRGWSEGRQRAFIFALSRCGSVARAARAVGMSPRSAYLLLDHARRRRDFCDFLAQTHTPLVTVNFCEVSRAIDRLEFEQLMKPSAPSPPGLFVAAAIAACNHSPGRSEVLTHSKKGRLTP